MALPVTAAHLRQEFDAGLRQTEAETKHIPAQVQRYVGRIDAGTYETGEAYENFDPENHAFEYISLKQAKFAKAPKWIVNSRRGPEEAADALAMKMALDRWSRDIDFRNRARQLYTDFCFADCIAVMEREPVPGSDEGVQTSVRKRPVFKRLSRKRFAKDPLAIALDECRWMGHESIRDKEDLLKLAEDKDSGWNAKVIETLTEGVGEMRRDKDAYRAPDRHEIRIREIWVPEHKLPEDDKGWMGVPVKFRDKMFHGTIFTLGIGKEDTTDFVRDPRPFFGPRWGPYHVGSYLFVPDEASGLSPFKAVEGQVREANAVARGMRLSMEKRKNIVVVSSKDASAADKIRDTRDGEVAIVNVDDIRTATMALPLGGTDEQQLAYREITKQSLSQASGINDAKRGNVTGNATATENAIAEAGDTARTTGEENQFDNFLAGVGRSAAWYIHYDDEYVAPVGNGETTYGGPPSAHGDEVRAAVAQLVGQDGQPFPEEVQAEIVTQLTDDDSWLKREFDDLEFEIEPGSMGQQNAAADQRTVMAVVPLVVSLIQGAAANPGLNVEPALDWIEKAFALPGVKKMLNTQGLQAMQMLNAQALQQASAPQEASEPRMAKDVKPSESKPTATPAAQAGSSGAMAKPMKPQAAGA